MYECVTSCILLLHMVKKSNVFVYIEMLAYYYGNQINWRIEILKLGVGHPGDTFYDKLITFTLQLT